MNKFKEQIMQAVFFLAAGISILSVLLICIFLFSSGFPAIFKIWITKFLFGISWKPSNNIFGIFLMIIGSIYVTIAVLLFFLSLGIMTSMYMAYFRPETSYNLLKRKVKMMEDIP